MKEPRATGVNAGSEGSRGDDAGSRGESRALGVGRWVSGAGERNRRTVIESVDQAGNQGICIGAYNTGSSYRGR